MTLTDRDYLDPDPPRLINDGFLDPQHPHYQPRRVGGCLMVLLFAGLFLFGWVIGRGLAECYSLAALPAPVEQDPDANVWAYLDGA